MKKYHLAQINIARFRLPAEDPVHADFMNALDHVNAMAEVQDGFIWRLVGEGNDATDIDIFNDPRMIVNMSVWEGRSVLAQFVYRNPAHLAVMRRRKEWFEEMSPSMALWWVKSGEVPTLEDAYARLQSLKEKGPTPYAFTFKDAFPSPDTENFLSD